jgi:hypothetical protein
LTTGFAVPKIHALNRGESRTSKQLCGGTSHEDNSSVWGRGDRRVGARHHGRQIQLCARLKIKIKDKNNDKQDKYTLQVPGGLAFSEVKGYEQWQVVGPSITEAANVIRVILANPVMIKAYQDGVPGNGKPFPDGSKIVKLEWKPKKITDPPFSAKTPDTVPGDLAQVEFIVGQQEIPGHARLGICHVRL